MVGFNLFYLSRVEANIIIFKAGRIQGNVIFSHRLTELKFYINGASYLYIAMIMLSHAIIVILLCSNNNCFNSTFSNFHCQYGTMVLWCCLNRFWSGAAKELTKGVIQILFLEESPLEVQSMSACSYLWYGPMPSTDTT